MLPKAPCADCERVSLGWAEGLACLDVSDHPHTGRISRRVKCAPGRGIVRGLRHRVAGRGCVPAFIRGRVVLGEGAGQGEGVGVPGNERQSPSSRRA